MIVQSGPRRSGARWLARWLLAAVAGALIGGAAVPSGAAAQAEGGRWWQTQWRMEEVWQIADGAGVTVAVIDTGVEPSVPELAGGVLPGIDLVHGRGDGREDLDEKSHGTAMAAFIAGRDAGRGFSGVAPGATILPITAHTGDDSTSGGAAAIEWESRGIRYAADQGAQVISISLAAPGDPRYDDYCPTPIADAVRYAASMDVIVVAGSGNIRDGFTSYYPGNCPGVLTVGATDSQLEPWPRSHASEFVDVAAPGVRLDGVAKDGRIGSGSGTSNSTALVAGAIALVRSHFPEATADEVLARILYTARDVHTPGRDDLTGHGLVRPYHALTESVPADAPNLVWERMGDLAAADTDPTPTQRPSGPPVADLGPPSQGQANGVSPTLVVAGIGLVLLLLLAAVGVILVVVLARGRRPATPAAHRPDPGGPPSDQPPPRRP